MKLSVITINYNDKNGLRKTIESVISQTAREEIEFIVIDGGSKDGSREVIEEYGNKIDYWVSEQDKGIYNAMNKGVSVAHGDYCNFMNSGDTFHDHNVVKSFVEMNLSEDIICGNTTTVEEKPWHIHPAEEITFDTLFNSSLNHQSAFIKTSIMKKYGYDENLKIVADRKFFLQALIFDNASYKSINLDIADYDVTGLSSSNRFASKDEYNSVLKSLIPERIRVDYGRRNNGSLYGDSDYERLFSELKGRTFKKIVYTATVLFIRAVSIFKKNASFIKSFPIILKD